MASLQNNTSSSSSSSTTTTTSTMKPLSADQLKRLLTEFNHQQYANVTEQEWWPPTQLNQLTSPVHIRHLIQRDCSMNKLLITLQNCQQEYKAYYSPARKSIVMCSNHIYSPREFYETLAHELIHMYDHCSWNAKFNDVTNLACSEIRAATVGECIQRPIENKRSCVTRIATNATSTSFDKNQSAEAVQRLMTLCYQPVVMSKDRIQQHLSPERK
jgi:hypothetical protein